MMTRWPGGVGSLFGAVTLLTFLTSSGTGCSLIAVQPPPEGPQPYPSAPLTCTSTMLAPLLDGVGAGVAVLAGGTMIVNDQMNGGSRLVPLAVGASGLVALLVYSANVGTNRVDACREMKEKDARRRARLLREGPPAAGRSAETVPSTGGPAAPQAAPPPVSPSTNGSGAPISPAPPPSVPQKADPE
jgi:hypothetical protein